MVPLSFTPSANIGSCRSNLLFLQDSATNDPLWAKDRPASYAQPAAGGTTISRNPFTLNFQAETGWNLAGGGPSEGEARPSYQHGVSSIVGSTRGVPDISSDADPNSGVWVMDSIPADGQGGPGSWWIVGGTSVASPTLAGIVNSAGHFFASTNAELTTVYDNLGTANFRDITQGSCFFYNGFFAGKGWDFCTGVGSPHGKGGE